MMQVMDEMAATPTPMQIAPPPLAVQTPLSPTPTALAAELATGVLENLSSICQCHEGFKCRNLTDPNCEYCNTNAGELRGIAEQLLAAIAEPVAGNIE